MSYVDLKHLLADLAIDAIRQPDRAAWVAVAAAYGKLSDRDPVVSQAALVRTAEELGGDIGWRPTTVDAMWLVKHGVLERRHEALNLKKEFVPHLAYMRRQTSRLLDAVRQVHNLEPQGRVSDLQRGVALFNAGLYFECHELLEAIWRATPGPERAFYHGLVQVAAAFYHYEKHNLHGARTLLTKGTAKLQGFSDHYQGVDLEAFRQRLQPWAAHFHDGAVPAPTTRPTLSVVTPVAGA